MKTMPENLLWVKCWVSDLRLAVDLLEDDEMGAFVRICLSYIETGEASPPTNASKSLRACLNQVLPHIAESIQQTMETSERQRANRKSGWDKLKADATTVNDGEQRNTTVYERSSREEKSKDRKEKEVEVEVENSSPTASSASHGFAVLNAGEADKTKELVRRYNLPADEVTREALAHDLDILGEKRLREVLEEACLKNSRERVTVRFYRSFLDEDELDRQTPFQSDEEEAEDEDLKYDRPIQLIDDWYTEKDEDFRYDWLVSLAYDTTSIDEKTFKVLADDTVKYGWWRVVYALHAVNPMDENAIALVNNGDDTKHDPPINVEAYRKKLSEIRDIPPEELVPFDDTLRFFVKVYSVEET